VRRRDEVLVGVTIIASLLAVLFGALWLSETTIGVDSQTYFARFRTVGGLGVGNPVMLRGVRVGRIQAIRLGAQDFVEAELTIYEAVAIPERPAVIGASASLFGEWQAELISLDEAPADPDVIRDLEAALDAGSDLWPGATLPDIGQLTAQASRIAGDIQTISSRVQTVFDSQAVGELQQAIRDFTGIARNINTFTQAQTEIMGDVGANLQGGSNVLLDAAQRLQASLARMDSATSEGELATIFDNTAAASADVRDALADLRSVVGVARANEATFVRLIEGADTLMARLQGGQGTAGMLLSDSALYVEARETVEALRSLIADIQANPRKYFKFSVF
jgi:phospholipid/cholesterol/gamma-HCH transport system substrate-binding protein